MQAFNQHNAGVKRNVMMVFFSKIVIMLPSASVFPKPPPETPVEIAFADVPF